MSGFGHDIFGGVPFGMAGWSHKMLVDVWPPELQDLVAERDGYLLTLCEALCPLFDAMIHEHAEADHWWDAWECRDEVRITQGFWWDGVEYKDSTTATLYADTKRTGAPEWDSSVFIPKGSLYIDADGKSWVVKDVRRGYQFGYVRSDGVSYIDLIEIDVACSKVGDIKVIGASPGIGHAILTQDGLLEWLASSIGAKWVSGLTEDYRRLLVGRHHQFVSMKGSVDGDAAFAKVHGYEAVVEGLYWLSADYVGRVPPAEVFNLVQRLVQYPMFWGDGVSNLVSSDGSLGTTCNYLKEDTNYRGALVEPAVGTDGDMLLEVWVSYGGVDTRYWLKDRGLGGGVGNLIPADTYPSAVTVCGSIDYATGKVVLRAYDLATPGIALGTFTKAKPVLVTFKRKGQYTRRAPTLPLFDEVPADYHVLDTYRWEAGGKIEFVDASVLLDAVVLPPFTVDTDWTLRMTIPSAPIQFPVLPKYGTAPGAWGDVSGRWVYVASDGAEHYLETIRAPAPGDPAYTLVRVKGTVPVAEGVGVLTYICPDGSSCGFALSHCVMATVSRPHLDAFFASPAPDYDSTLLSRFGETLGVQEEMLEVQEEMLEVP